MGGGTRTHAARIRVDQNFWVGGVPVARAVRTERDTERVDTLDNCEVGWK